MATSTRAENHFQIAPVYNSNVSGHTTSIRGNVLWLCFYGPALTLLPERYRPPKSVQKFGSWSTATLISGFLECMFGANTLIYWYKEEVDRLVFLWIAIYLLCDGVWRIMILRVHNESVGTVFLAAVDQIFLTGKQALWSAAHPAVADLVVLEDRNPQWQLKIESSRSKRDWETARLVHYDQRFFRIETVLNASGPRPFVYLLRALPAGVLGPRVINYPPPDVSRVPN